MKRPGASAVFAGLFLTLFASSVRMSRAHAQEPQQQGSEGQNESREYMDLENDRDDDAFDDENENAQEIYEDRRGVMAERGGGDDALHDDDMDDDRAADQQDDQRPVELEDINLRP